MTRLLSLIFSWIVLINLSYSQQHRASLDPTLRPFYHGVASGDPTENSVMIWTRVTPDSGNADNIDVYWQIASDTAFFNVVNYGKLTAWQSTDFCVKADVCGLQPNTFYYYMFNANGRNSITGRTKTAPAAGSDNDSVRFAVVSCADYENGYFNAYQSIVNKNNVDAVVHLGDYIYEYETGGISINNPGRAYEPLTEVISLQDYRIRHSHYKLDPQLRRIHQMFPFITVWDDHETCNDAYRDGGQNHQTNEGPFSVRKLNATSTYFTWMPLRKPDPLDTIRIFRKLRYGKLLDLVMLDTRLYDRDLQDIGNANSSNHKLMGPIEMAWFLQQLSDTSTRWKVIGNQVMFAPLQILGQPFNADQWDGYNYERTLIQNHIVNNNIKDVVVLTGDIHTSWCNDVPGPNYDANTGAGSICVEFVGTSCTSVNSPLPVGVGIIQSMNPHMKYIDLDHHGYYILDVRKGRAQADYTYVITDQLGSPDDEAASFYVNDNERHLRQGTPVFNYPGFTAPTPSTGSNQNIGVIKITDEYLNIDENTSATVNLIPSANICPAISLNLIDPANHGATISLNGKDVVYSPAPDYFGQDTVIYTVCTNSAPINCDTIYIYITVNSITGIDTVYGDLDNDSTISACLTFDDIALVSGTVGSSAPLFGILNIQDTCFSYFPDSNFCGIETLTFTACAGAGACDTVVYVIRVKPSLSASTIGLYLNKNSNLLYCPVFDDLVCPAQSLSFLKTPAHGTYQLSGDSCFRYFPFFNYVGTDTVILVGCDTCGSDHCDTLTMLYTIADPSSLQDNKMVVLGIYPNPAEDMLYIQYFLPESLPVQFNVYSSNGKLISTDEYNSNLTGVQYSRMNVLDLPAGIFVFEMRAGKSVYSKSILKK